MNFFPFQPPFARIVLVTVIVVFFMVTFADGSGQTDGVRNNREKNGTAVESRGGGGRRGRGRGNNGKTADGRNGERPRRHRHSDLSMWIDEKQVKLFSGKSQFHNLT